MKQQQTGNSDEICPHVSFQQVIHAVLRHVLRLVKLLQRLSNFLIGDLALTLLLVVVIQAPAFQLLQVVLTGQEPRLIQDGRT